MNSERPDARSGMTATALVVIGLALIGLVAGTRETGYVPALPTAKASKPTPATGIARPARTYTELMTQPWGTQPTRRGAMKRALYATRHDRVPATDAQARAAALEARAQHRAFSGAPPTIPHPVSQGNGRECGMCHAQGGTLGATLAPPRSHPKLEQCTQCHVPERSGAPATAQAFSVASDFEPLRGAPAPSRWSIAPPQMPHTSWMRERCESCHGTFGRHGLQTSHPQRQSCLQCHAPAAVLEQLPVGP